MVIMTVGDVESGDDGGDDNGIVLSVEVAPSPLMMCVISPAQSRPLLEVLKKELVVFSVSVKAG